MENFDLGETLYSDEKATRELLNRKDGLQPFDLSRLTLGSEISAGDYSATFLVDKILPENSITLFYARGGSGKSTIATQMASAIVSSKPFMGLDTIKRPVVIIDYENPLAVLSNRLKVIDGSGEIYFWLGGNNPPQLNKSKWKELKILVATLVNPLIIIDTLSSSCSGLDILSNGDFSPIMHNIVELRNIGSTVILLHHTPKQDETKYIGASTIYNNCDHILAMYPVKTPDTQKEMTDEDDAKIYRLGTKDKSRFEHYAIYVEFDYDKKIFVPSSDPDQEVIDRLYRIIADNAPINQRDILKEFGSDESRGKLKRLLNRNEGRLWNVTKGEHNAKDYRPIQFSSFSPISNEQLNIRKPDILSDRETDQINNVQITENNELFSYSPAVLQTEKQTIIQVEEIL